MDEDTAFWAALAAEYLRSLFAAAMLAGLDARAVAGWIRRGTFAEAREHFAGSRHGCACPPAGRVR